MSILGPLLVAHFRDQMASRRQAEAAARNQQLVQGLLGAPGMFPGMQGSGMMPADFALPNAPEVVGSGLMARPDDPSAWLQFAGGLMTSPELAPQGASLLNNLLSNQFQNERQGIALAQGQAQFEAEQSRLSDQFEQTYNQRDQHHRDTLDQRTYFDMLEHQRKVEAAEGAIPASIKGDYQLRTLPDGTPMLVPLAGTKPWNQAIGKLQNQREAITQIDELTRLVARSGADTWGRGAARRRTLYGFLTSAIGQAQELGTLQPGDLERVQETLQNPGEWTLAQKGTILEQLMTLREIFVRDHRNDQQRYQMLDGLGDLLTWDDPEGEAIRAMQAGDDAQSERALEQARQMGLTPVAPRARRRSGAPLFFDEGGTGGLGFGEAAP